MFKRHIVELFKKKISKMEIFKKKKCVKNLPVEKNRRFIVFAGRKGPFDDKCWAVTNFY